MTQGLTPGQGMRHGDQQSKTAGDRVLDAHGAIERVIGLIEGTVNDVKAKGWTEGPAALKFHKAAMEMVADARLVQGKLHEIHGSLNTMNRNVTAGNQELLQEVDRVTTASDQIATPSKSYTI